MRTAVAAVGAAFLLVAAPAGAAPQDVANEIANEMMSPYCPGVTLHDCPSDSARELRTRIVGWAEAGWTEDRIWERLESDFGEGIYAAPPTDGSGFGAWLLPILAVVAGVALAGVLAVKWSRASGDGLTPPAEDLPEEQRARLDAELAALRESGG